MNAPKAGQILSGSSVTVAVLFFTILYCVSPSLSENGDAAALGVLIATNLPDAAASAQTRDTKKQYAKMAPLDQYLMGRDAEIALARSAAPEAISRDATVLVLGPHGWEKAVKGTNGFVCMVERPWAGGINSYELWNPKMRGPDCLNPVAAQYILPIVYKLTQMTLAGVHSEKERIAGIEAAFAKKELRPLAPGAMGYMMSKDAYLTPVGNHNLSHLMFFVPTRNVSEWGAGLPHSPIGSVSYWFPDPDQENPLDKELPPLRFLVVAVPRWSDGTMAVTH